MTKTLFWTGLNRLLHCLICWYLVGLHLECNKECIAKMSLSPTQQSCFHLHSIQLISPLCCITLLMWLWLRSSAFGSGPYCIAPSRTVWSIPLRTVLGWLRALKCFCGKHIKACLWGTHSICFAPGYWVQHVAHQGVHVPIEVRDALDHTGKYSAVARFQTGSTWVWFGFRCVHVPFWCGTVWVQHALRKCLNAPIGWRHACMHEVLLENP